MVLEAKVMCNRRWMNAGRMFYKIPRHSPCSALLFNTSSDTIVIFSMTSHDPLFLCHSQRAQIQLHIELNSRQLPPGLVVLACLQDAALHRAKSPHNCWTFGQHNNFPCFNLLLAGCKGWSAEMVLLGVRNWTLYLSVVRCYWWGMKIEDSYEIFWWNFRFQMENKQEEQTRRVLLVSSSTMGKFPF